MPSRPRDGNTRSSQPRQSLGLTATPTPTTNPRVRAKPRRRHGGWRTPSQRPDHRGAGVPRLERDAGADLYGAAGRWRDILFLEWLAEWGREARRRQHGLLLLTAPRRLLYVAMTRARKTLELMRFEAGPAFAEAEPPPEIAEPRAAYRVEQRNPLPAELKSSAAVLRRATAPVPPASSELEFRYQRLAMREVDLGFAGRRPAGHPLHKAIADLAPGDALTVRQTCGTRKRWDLLDGAGQRVGRLANSFQPPAGMRCHAATVLAIVAWGRDHAEPQYAQSIKCDAWEVVLPELTFAPDNA